MEVNEEVIRDNELIKDDEGNNEEKETTLASIKPRKILTVEPMSLKSEASSPFFYLLPFLAILFLPVIFIKCLRRLKRRRKMFQLWNQKALRLN